MNREILYPTCFNSILSGFAVRMLHCSNTLVHYQSVCRVRFAALMMWWFRAAAILALFVMLFCISLGSLAAQDTVSGIVNRYAPVLEIRNCSVRLPLIDSFSVGDRVLIVQMQGAEILLTQNTIGSDSAFGVVQSIGGAGLCELNTVVAKQGNWLHLAGAPATDFSVQGAVQIIRVHRSKRLVVNDLVTCTPWNGQTGGVVALEGVESISLDADIDVRGKGFRGGAATQFGTAPPIGESSHPYFSLLGPYAGHKGEGVAMLPREYVVGRGAAANGGGGGNGLDAGGGGGSNWNGGGAGGASGLPFRDGNCQGLGGYGLQSASSGQLRVFMGGGGGGGHGDGSSATSGGNGGGIIILIAGQIEGRGHSLRADGDDALVAYSDGAGGGGAGGTIVLQSPELVSPIVLSSSGGKGGDVYTDDYSGPGGGGSAGRIVLQASALREELIVNLTFGLAGLLHRPEVTAFGQSDGSQGTMDFARSLPRSVTSFNNSLISDDSVKICPSAAITISAVAGFDTYTWDPTGELGQVITITQPGRYRVYATNSVDCSFYDSLIVVFDELPEPASVTRCGDFLFAEGTGRLQWTLDGDPLTGETGIRLQVRRPGEYAVETITSAGCVVRSLPIRVDAPFSATIQVGLQGANVELGHRFRIPITVRSQQNIVQRPIPFVLFMRIPEGVLLLDTAVSVASADKGYRAAELRGEWDGVENVLVDLPFIPVLGNSDRGVIYIDSIQWSALCSVTSAPDSATVLVSGFCYAGGSPFVDAADSPSEVLIKPNPAALSVTISFVALEDGPLRVYLSDFTGKEIRTLYWDNVRAGKFEWETELSGIASGNYIVMVKSNGRSFSRVLQVKK